MLFVFNGFFGKWGKKYLVVKNNLHSNSNPWSLYNHPFTLPLSIAAYILRYFFLKYYLVKQTLGKFYVKFLKFFCPWSSFLILYIALINTHLNCYYTVWSTGRCIKVGEWNRLCSSLLEGKRWLILCQSSGLYTIANMHLNKLNCLHWTGLSSKATLLRLHSSPLSLSFQHRFVAETKWIYIEIPSLRVSPQNCSRDQVQLLLNSALLIPA